MRAVVDASVPIRSVVPGPDTDDVRLWMTRTERLWMTRTEQLWAPHLVLYEVTSALRRLEHLQKLPGSAAERSLQLLQSLSIHLLSPTRLVRESVAPRSSTQCCPNI